MLGKIFVVSGPSGSGKSTITKKVRDLLNIPLSISATSRKARVGEINGKDYYFLSEKEFVEKINNNEFFEYAKVHGNYYGTLNSVIDEKLQNGQNIILEIDVQGGLIAKSKRSDAILIFCKTKDENILESRLRNRKADNEEVISLRLKNAKEELKFENKYDYVIINDKLDEAIDTLINIIKEESKNEKTKNNS